jgi:hypothetical protein
MQAGFICCACNGDVQAGAGTGGENLSGGLWAKGMPRYAFTEAADVPTMTPEGIVTVGETALE